jgi:hypothetical protein
MCKERLADGKNKDLKEIAEMILEIKREILKIMQPFVDLKYAQTLDLKPRQTTVEGGEKLCLIKKV